MLLVLVTTSATFAQKRTYSPLSRYGVGELNTYGYGQNTGMGHSGIGIRTNEHINFLNPASYSAIDTMSFYFETGLTGNSQTFESTGGQEKYNNIDFSYFAMGFSLSKNIKTSLGLRPFSNAGYKFEFSDNTSTTRAVGTGNLSAAYGGLSIRVIPQLSLGMHATYLFGNLRHTTFIEFSEDDNAYKYGLQNEMHASDFFLDFGAQFSHQINETDQITAGITFRPQSEIGGDFQRTAAKGLDYAEDGKLFSSNYIIPEASDTLDVSGFEMARSVGFGLSYSKSDFLTLSADYVLSNWGEINFPDGLTQTKNNSRFSAGAEIIPNFRSTNYLSRIRYRAGIHYGDQYIMINDNDLKNFGITFGLGLPLNRTKTSVNIAFEYGTVKPSGNLDINENYAKISLNFTFHEFWFIQRKFD
ncbi:hypothetical protein ACT29H_10740 [Thermophagus sp. OGC60D27]|uniref:hypothetical protein n=1 Tax=Thermophagus sp. OGC60D27 TaxID=3458415 RepID=UPI0040381927